MLVLSRRLGESVIIGSNIRVTVVDVRGDQIRLGIDAPRSISVHREEVFRQVQDANAAAAATDLSNLWLILVIQFPPNILLDSFF